MLRYDIIRRFHCKVKLLNILLSWYSVLSLSLCFLWRFLLNELIWKLWACVSKDDYKKETVNQAVKNQHNVHIICEMSACCAEGSVARGMDAACRSWWRVTRMIDSERRKERTFWTITCRLNPFLRSASSIQNPGLTHWSVLTHDHQVLVVLCLSVCLQFGFLSSLFPRQICAVLIEIQKSREL